MQFKKFINVFKKFQINQNNIWSQLGNSSIYNLKFKYWNKRKYSIFSQEIKQSLPNNIQHNPGYTPIWLLNIEIISCFSRQLPLNKQTNRQKQKTIRFSTVTLKASTGISAITCCINIYFLNDRVAVIKKIPEIWCLKKHFMI